MKTSITLTFNNHVSESMKKKLAGGSLSNFTNSLYIDWLETRKKEKEEIITACKEAAKSKVYREMAELTEKLALEN